MAGAAKSAGVTLGGCFGVMMLLGVVSLPRGVPGQTPACGPLDAEIDRRCAQVEPQMIAWRRDFHEHPELSNRESRTAAVVAEHLRKLGMEVRTGVGHTGVVGVLRGGQAGPVVALRADMDALPVTEVVDLPFASKVKAQYNGREVGVMHACGHDIHTAVLMGVAQVLAELREQLPGTVKFIFQPAEEGAPDGEQGGAELMIREGALDNPRPAAILGLHVSAKYHTGTLAYRAGATMAACDDLSIVIRGRQTHGAQPWTGVDPIVAACQVVLGLQTIVSRQADLTEAPAVITIGSIHGGVRSNIIPDEVQMIGTLRTFDPKMRTDLHERIRKTATLIAQGAGATAEVVIDPGYPVTLNDPNLAGRLTPVLQMVAGKGHMVQAPVVTGAEDFSYYQRQIPGLYFFLGVTPEGTDPNTAPMCHSPRFCADERALVVGARAMAHLAIAGLEGRK